MSNKNLFSNIFKQKINKNDNYKKIISRICFDEKRSTKKRKYVFFPIAACICALILFCITLISNNRDTQFSGEFYNGLPIEYKHTSYALNVSTPEKAIGASRYVFVTKINSILRTEYLNPTKVESGLFSTETVYDPYTVYSIDVIQNIKGELITSEPIELMQNGGLSKDGESYIFVEDSRPLNVGEYYIILTGAIEDGGILEVTNPDRIVSLGKIEVNVLQNIINGNITENMKADEVINGVIEKIKKYISASKNEESPDVLFDGNMPVLDNISKYDVNYNR